MGERVLGTGPGAYSATKRAAKIVTQDLFGERGSQGVTVKNVQPDPLDTDLNRATDEWATPKSRGEAATVLDRYRNVDEIAAMVGFVAGPECSYITGASLVVDGG